MASIDNTQRSRFFNWQTTGLLLAGAGAALALAPRAFPEVEWLRIPQATRIDAAAMAAGLTLAIAARFLTKTDESNEAEVNNEAEITEL